MKLQSAIEYLTTYGWAFLILAIIIGVFIAAGILSPFRIIGNECILPAGFSCYSTTLYSNGLLVINLFQATQSPINVTAIGCSSTPNNIVMTPIYNPPSNQISMPISSNYTFSLYCYNGNNIATGSVGTEFQGVLIINYTDTLSGFAHFAYGKVVLTYQ